MQKLLFIGHALKSVDGGLAGLLLDKVVELALLLVSGDRNHEVELVPLRLHDFLDRLPHLVNEVDVELGIELVSCVLLESLQRT